LYFLIIPHLYCFAGTIPKVWLPLQDFEIIFGKERENEEEFLILL